MNASLSKIPHFLSDSSIWTRGKDTENLPLSEASLFTSSFADKDWRPKGAQKIDLEWINLYFNWRATQRATSKYWMILLSAQRIGIRPFYRWLSLQCYFFVALSMRSTYHYAAYKVVVLFWRCRPLPVAVASLVACVAANHNGTIHWYSRNFSEPLIWDAYV